MQLILFVGVMCGGMLLIGIGYLKFTDWLNDNKERGVGKYAHTAHSGLCWLYICTVFRRLFWE